MITQLNPQIPVFVVSKDQEGRALGWIDYSPEHPLYWIVALENREVWVVKNEEIRLLRNFTLDYDYAKGGADETKHKQGMVGSTRKKIPGD